MKNKQTNKQSKENYYQYYLPNCAQGLIFCFESPGNKIKGNLCTENHGQPISNIKTHKPQEQPKDEGGTVVKANNNNNKKKTASVHPICRQSKSIQQCTYQLELQDTRLTEQLWRSLIFCCGYCAVKLDSQSPAGNTPPIIKLRSTGLCFPFSAR